VKLLLDACVLYPTVMREVLLSVARQGMFTPLWSARILEEWARAARKLGPEGEMLARGDVARARAAWPGALVAPRPGLEARLWLPDPNDIHVLSAAIASSADAVVTMNARDFPRATLAEEGVLRFDPDTILIELWQRDPDAVSGAVEGVRQTAEHLSGQPQPVRALLKKARLPRLGKALAAD